MKILKAVQVREADNYTIANEPIASIDLMERAALNCTDEICKLYNPEKEFVVFAGPGNNGGDGLAIARLLIKRSYSVKVYGINLNNKFSNDFTENLSKLNESAPDCFTSISEIDEFPELSGNEIIIDSIFGSGLSRKISGFAKEVVRKLNNLKLEIIAIDIPSGMFGEENYINRQTIVRAKYTLTFEFPFLSFFFPENDQFTGIFYIISIGISTKYIDEVTTNHYFTLKHDIKKILKKRDKFSHKGNFGHSLIFAGSYGKAGACILAVKAAHRAGAGLVTASVPECNYQILQISSPETMLNIDGKKKFISTLPDISTYNSIAIGPGIGFNTKTKKMFKQLIQNSGIPLVVDADGLTILSENKEWLDLLPKKSILTPHPKEFERLFGKFDNSFQRNKKLLELCVKYDICIVLKGANTCVALPSGDCYFNSTGNPAMATGGSGDVLTGIIAGFLAQNYSPENAAILGVYFHGLAGDSAIENPHRKVIIASDIIENIKIDI